MPGYIPDHIIEEIRRRIDIVSLVSQHVSLKRSGKNFFGLCPFHEEKTPSFSVNPERQFFKCFGCGEGGDVFTFVMRRDNLSYPEAVRQLAEQAHVEIAPETPQARQEEELRSRLYEVHRWAASAYQKWLLETGEGKKALEYMGSRQISQDSIARFGLGLALPGWDHLLRAGRAQGYDVAILEQAGLAVPRPGGNGHYDRFRNRIMFSIADVQGRVIGFGARALGEDQPKYLNSPDTLLFDKGRVLYGLHLARDAISKRRQAVVMEGYTDVIMAHQHGLRRCVAVLGTALGRHHVAALRRYADEVILVFDADAAGQASTDRSLDIFVQEDLPVRVAVLPKGMDPCDMLCQDGAEALEERLEHSRDVFEFRFDRMKQQYDVSTIDGRAASAKGLAAMAAKMPDPIKRNVLVRRIAEEFQISEEAVWEYARYDGRTARSASAPAAPSAPGGAYLAQTAIIEAMLMRPDLIPAAAEQNDVKIDDAGLSHIFNEILRRHNEERSVAPEDVMASLGDPALTRIIANILSEADDGKDYDAVLADSIGYLRRISLKQQRRELLRAAQSAEAKDAEELMRRFHLARQAAEK